MPLDPFLPFSIFMARSEISKIWRIPLAFTICLTLGIILCCVFSDAKEVISISIGSGIVGVIAGIVWHAKS